MDLFSIFSLGTPLLEGGWGTTFNSNFENGIVHLVAQNLLFHMLDFVKKMNIAGGPLKGTACDILKMAKRGL